MPDTLQLTSTGNQPASRLAASLRVIIFSALPLLVTLVLVRGVLGARLADAFPLWNDEVSYWMQVNTFKTAGFDGGYFTANEQPAPAKFSRFYAWGPVYPALMGLAARVTGWQPITPVYYNLAFITAAFLIFCVAAKPTIRQMVLASLLIATYWPLHFYLPTAMQEALHMAAAVAIAPALYRLADSQLSPRAIVVLTGAVLFFSLLRATWSFLLPAVFWLGSRNLPLRRRLAAAGGSVVLVLGVFALYQFLSAPFPNFASRLIETASGDLPAAWQMLTTNTIDNLQTFLVVRSGSGILWSLVRYQSLLLVGFAGAVIAVGFFRPSRRMPFRLAEPSSQASTVFIAASTGLVMVFVITLYLVGAARDYRMLAAPVLLAVLLLILDNRIWLSSIVIAGNILATGIFLSTYTADYAPRFDPANSHLPEMLPEVAFTPSADGWCNTIVMEKVIVTDDYLPLMTLPAGFGFSWVDDFTALDGIRSRYVLLQDTPDMQALIERYSLEYFAPAPQGDVFINPAVSCP